MEGIFPNCLKTSIVVPIHKKGDPKDPKNYRPIALVPIFSKIIEKIMLKQLVSYFETNNLICENQFGFRSGRSTTDALIKIVEQIYSSFESRTSAILTALDLSRAFDMISHRILLKTIVHYGHLRQGLGPNSNLFD